MARYSSLWSHPIKSPDCVPEETQTEFPSPYVKVWSDKTINSMPKLRQGRKPGFPGDKTVPLWDKSLEPTHSGHRKATQGHGATSDPLILLCWPQA